MVARWSGFVFALSLLATGFAGRASAETRIDYRVQGNAPVIESMLIGNGKVRINQHGGQYWMLYDDATHKFYVVDVANRQYMDISFDGVRRMRKSTDAMIGYLDEQWPKLRESMRTLDRYPGFRNPGQMARSNLPRISRVLRARGVDTSELPTEAELEDVYRGFDEVEREGGMEGYLVAQARKHYRWMLDNTPVFDYRNAGEQTVEGRRCRLTETSITTRASRRPIKANDYCVADASSLGLPEADRKALDGLVAVSRESTSLVGEMTVVPPAIARELGVQSRMKIGLDRMPMEGVPVLMRFYAGGRPNSTSTLATVTRDADFPSALLSIPEGYVRNDVDMQVEKVFKSSLAMTAAVEAATGEGE